MIAPRHFIPALLLLFPVLVNAAVPEISYSWSLERKLNSALKQLPADYTPRTRHLCQNKAPCFTNRLILEDSPYLRQHAHNPVNWYSWSQEALATAQRENKPIFLSIGYSTCHWCHVMERESFDDLDVARVLNKDFIAIKVDREQRPDLDELYGYVPAITGKGSGWPTTILLTPEGDAFFGGVYYPKHQLLNLLAGSQNAWRNRRDDIYKSAQVIMTSLRSINTSRKTTGGIKPELISRAIKEITSQYDEFNGGFGETIKFPHESWLLFLLNNAATSGHNTKLNKILSGTLNAMANGAIHDHVGGGFHRYTVDPRWTEPHYEKMLYNQALLAQVYLQAHTIYNNPEYLDVALKTLDFVLENMKSGNGLFWSAMDADSVIEGDNSGEAEEGAYYTWHVHEIDKALTRKQYRLFSSVYAIDQHDDDIISQTLNRRNTLTSIAHSRKMSLQQLTDQLDKIHQRLRHLRIQRPAPMIDKKSIVGWNSMFISALAMAAQLTGSEKYRAAAIQATDYIWSQMKTKNGFYRIHFNNKPHTSAQLEDYAYYLQALNRLYGLDNDKRWLKRSQDVSNIMYEQFWDKKQGGFYHTTSHITGSMAAVIRPKSAMDRSLASANAVAAQALLHLWQLTGEKKYRQWALTTIDNFSADAKQAPSSHASLLLAASHATAPSLLGPSYAARGNIKLMARYKTTSKKRHQLTVNVHIKEGWHINSSAPLEEYLIPTILELVSPDKTNKWKLRHAQYPQAEILDVGFSDARLSLYKGNVSIEAELATAGRPVISPVIRLHLQACDDKSCLPPEKIRLLAMPGR